MSRIRSDWLVRLVGAVAVVTVGVGAFSLTRLASPGPPEMVYQNAISLGPQEFGTSALGRVRLTNTGAGELVVGSFRTSCSCAGIEVERNGQFEKIGELRIPPHSQSVIFVRITVGALPGLSQNVAVMFQTNDPKQPIGTVDLEIPQILGGVFAMPISAVFDHERNDSETVRELFIYDNGFPSRTIERVRVSHPERFEVELVPPKSGLHEPQTHETAGHMIAVARVRPKAGYVGPLDGYFELFVAGEERPPDRFEVIGRIEGPYARTPEALTLPRMVAGQPDYRVSGKLSGVTVGRSP